MAAANTTPVVIKESISLTVFTVLGIRNVTIPTAIGIQIVRKRMLKFIFPSPYEKVPGFEIIPL